MLSDPRFVKLIRSESREAWLLERAKSLGSSDAAGVLGVSPFTTPLQVYVSKTQPAEDESESDQLRWGHRLEQPVADEFQEREENAAFELGCPPKHSLFRAPGSYLHATPDRLLQRRQAMGTRAGVLEIKATRYRAEDWDEGIPLHVNVQVQHQLLVLGVDLAYVAVLIQGFEYRQFELHADRSFQEALAEKLAAFWKGVQNRTPPAPSGAADYDTVRRMFRVSTAKKVMLPAESAFDFDLWLAAKESRLASEKHEKAAGAKLMAAIGDAEEGVLPDGRVIRWVTQQEEHKARPAKTITKRVLREAKKREIEGGRHERLSGGSESEAQLGAGTSEPHEVAVRDGLAEAPLGGPHDAGGADGVLQEPTAP